ncbi:hypothetical protein ACFL96_11265 [Thermoproteota archaeon]
MKKIISLCIAMIALCGIAIADTTITDSGVYSPFLSGELHCSNIMGSSADLCALDGGGNCSVDQSCNEIIYWSDEGTFNASYATNADYATDAGHATSADTATNANSASTASNLACSSCVSGSEVDSSQIQTRVTGTCNSGYSIRTISSTGTVTCEQDDTGISSCSSCDSRFVNAGGDTITGNVYFDDSSGNSPYLWFEDGSSTYDSFIYYASSAATLLLGSDQDITLDSTDDTYLDAGDTFNANSGSNMYLDSGNDMYFYAYDDIFIHPDDDIILDADYTVRPDVDYWVDLGSSSYAFDRCYCYDFQTASVGFQKPKDKSAVEVLKKVKTLPNGEIDHSTVDYSLAGKKNKDKKSKDEKKSTSNSTEEDPADQERHTVSLNAMTVACAEAVGELDDQIITLEKRIAELEKQIKKQ